MSLVFIISHTITQYTTMDSNLYYIIMAGGVGSRFWPASRTVRPKQFLDILGIGETLIQQTYNRFIKYTTPENIYIVTHESYQQHIHDQLPAVKDSQLIYEPSRRNTAPCIAYAVEKIKALNPNAILVIAPSDHLILKEDVFIQTVHTAAEFAAQNDGIITLGITPTFPSTGYGYIQYLETDAVVKKVKMFTEKPPQDVAQTFLESGDFVWNAGLFIGSVNSLSDAIREHCSYIYDAFEEIKMYLNTPDEYEYIRSIYTSFPKDISFDVGIMEKANNVYVIPAAFGWSDLGTWGAVYDTITKDANSNVVNAANAVLHDTKNSIIFAENQKVIFVQGLDNFIVVDSKDALLICQKDREQDIKKYVNEIKLTKGHKYL